MVNIFNKKTKRRRYSYSVPAWKKDAGLVFSAGTAAPINVFKPESIVSRAKKNSNLLNRIKYKPIGGRRRRRNFPPVKNTKQKTLNFAFTMPLLPVMCFLVLATIFVIDNRDAISAMVSRDAIPALPADEGGLTEMASFAGAASGGTAGVSANTGIAAGTDTALSAAAAAGEAPGTVSSPGNTVITVGAVISEPIKDQPVPLKMTEYFAWESYTVKKGDSVSSIAAAHGLSMDAVIASNNLTNAHLLKIGQVLRLPNMNGIPYVVKKGDNLSKISRAYNIPLEVLVDVNNIQKDLIIPGQNIFLPGAKMPATDFSRALGTLFVSPLSGTKPALSSGFGWREDPFGAGQKLHEAIDMAIASGTPVKAASAGKVSMVGVSAVYGNYIIINHSDNMQTLYAHLSVISIKMGDNVNQGTKIGEVGSTGMSTGPHLHFAVYKNGHAVNPLDYITM
ncbi:MAG: M23 family metallopeptidase [Treponema sp.]|nr:M23 family metallopeptidase [Treponema sp.]